MNPRRLERLDKWMLWILNLSIIAEIVLNFIDSYGHIYVEGLKYGEYGTDARTLPLAIDVLLTCLAIANVFAARYERRSPWLRLGLAFGVGGTVAANAAYGASWGLTGGFLAVFAPVALFITVECGLFVWRIVADLVREARNSERARKAAETRRRRHPADPVAGPSVETMKRVMANLPDEKSPEPAPFAPSPPLDAEAWRGLSGIGLRNGGR